MTTTEEPRKEQKIELDASFREEFIGPTVLVVRPNAFAAGRADYAKANQQRVRK